MKIMECIQCGVMCKLNYHNIIAFKMGKFEHNVILCSRKCIRNYYEEYGKEGSVEERINRLEISISRLFSHMYELRGRMINEIRFE